MPSTMHRVSTYITLILVALFPIIAFSQVSRMMSARIKSYTDSFLMPVAKNQSEMDQSIAAFVSKDSLFLSRLRTAIRGADYQYDYPDIVRGVDLNLRFRNYSVTDAIPLDHTTTFVSILLRSQQGSEDPQLEEAIGLLGRPRDNYYVIFELEGPHHIIRSPRVIVNAYWDLHFNKVQLPRRSLVYAIFNESSFGGDYTNFVLRIFDPTKNLKPIIDEPIFIEDEHREDYSIMMCRFGFSNDSLQITGVQYNGDTDSAIVSKAFKIH